MYNPVQDGIEKTVRSVTYTEAKPPSDLAGLVHSFWELKTEETLSRDFQLHALPDACVNILFNQHDPSIAGITALRTTYEILNLGKSFHYVGVQLLPGVWRGNRKDIADSFVGEPYHGPLPLVEISKKMATLNFATKQPIMAEFVRELADQEIILPNHVTSKILANLDTIQTVADMAAATSLSPRQLQRILPQTTGFSPHDFLKVMRLQRSFTQNYLLSYADQSHFIHSFRKITGYTPAQYFDKFDV